MRDLSFVFSNYFSFDCSVIFFVGKKNGKTIFPQRCDNFPVIKKIITKILSQGCDNFPVIKKIITKILSQDCGNFFLKRKIITGFCCNYSVSKTIVVSVRWLYLLFRKVKNKGNDQNNVLFLPFSKAHQSAAK